MRILIDTNIFIQLEDSNKEITDEFAEFHKIANKYCQLCVHPKSKEDINRDMNSKRKKEMFSRIKKYDELVFPPEPSLEFLSSIQCNCDNQRDIIDAYILFALKQNCVTILISEDNGLHSRARRISQENVYRLSEALEFLKSLYEKVQVELPHISNEKLYNLNIDDPIFDTLKIDYPAVDGSPNFEKWFIDGQQKGRDAWTYYLKGTKTLGGICIYKDESNVCKYFCGKVMKLCTFKVAEHSQGKKVGELLIKNLFNYCVENNYERVYVTVFEKHSLLTQLFVDFGFQYLEGAETQRGENIYFKEFLKPSLELTNKFNNVEFYIRYSPYFKTARKSNKYIVPIMPIYHELLFPEYPSAQMELFLENESKVCGNSIKKAYLCKCKRKDLKAGDLIMFYRSKDAKKVTTLGIIDNIKRSSNPEIISALVGKRTVFPLDIIKSMCTSDVLVILFRQMGHFNEGMSYKEMARRKIIKNRLETITPISHNSFELINKEYSNECILTN